MWLTNLVSVLAAACFLVSPCLTAAVPEAAVDTKTERLGTLNRYYLTSWEHMTFDRDLEPVINSEAGIAALTLTGTENIAIVVHGRRSSTHSEFGHTLKSSLVAADKHMAVILVDWSLLASINYNQAAAIVPSIADDLIAFIAQMEASGKLNRDLLHLIGFDLGAHIVGIASRNPSARARKITALSPAGDRWGPFSQRLRVTDAEYVETINTDAFGEGAYGIAEGIGILNFFPNGGTGQPGCGDSDHWCYHNRAWHLFSATVDTGGHLSGLRCESMTQVDYDTCFGVPAAVMGTLQLIKLQTGIYRVNTGSAWPYSP